LNQGDSSVISSSFDSTIVPSFSLCCVFLSTHLHSIPDIALNMIVSRSDHALEHADICLTHHAIKLHHPKFLCHSFPPPSSHSISLLLSHLLRQKCASSTLLIISGQDIVSTSFHSPPPKHTHTRTQTDSPQMGYDYIGCLRCGLSLQERDHTTIIRAAYHSLALWSSDHGIDT